MPSTGENFILGGCNHVSHDNPPITPGGDIFIHAKSNNYSKLFELTQTVVRSFPAGTIQKAEDYYGWTFQEGRDLSGFIDGEGGLDFSGMGGEVWSGETLSVWGMARAYSNTSTGRH